jgi:hypothetical protein
MMPVRRWSILPTWKGRPSTTESRFPVSVLKSAPADPPLCKKGRLVVSAIALFLVLTQVRADGCKNDLECKGDRICDAGRCINPPAPPSQSVSAPAGNSSSELRLVEPKQEASSEPIQAPQDADWRRSVLTAGVSLGVAFLPQPTGGQLGYGFDVQYEFALRRVVSIAFDAALSPAVTNTGPAFGLGVALPIYILGRAPSGLWLAPSVALTLTPVVVPSLGISFGYQLVTEHGFTLGISAGPSFAFTSGLVVIGLGISVGLGYAF